MCRVFDPIRGPEAAVCELESQVQPATVAIVIGGYSMRWKTIAELKLSHRATLNELGSSKTMGNKFRVLNDIIVIKLGIVDSRLCTSLVDAAMTRSRHADGRASNPRCHYPGRFP
jgi:hypothetical protein